MIDKRTLKNRFSKNAYSYDEYASVQKQMAEAVAEEARVASSEMDSPEVLEIGCGTGYLTERLLRVVEKANVLALDLAPGMIAECRKKISDRNVDFICEDVECFEPDGTYDLVVSSATFQWLNDMEKTFKKLLCTVNPGGAVLFSTFGKETFKELHSSFEQAKNELGLDESSSPGQSFYSVEEIADILKRSAEDLKVNCKIEVSESLECERFSSVREFLQSVKKIGAGNSNSGRRAKSPALIKRMIDIYEERYAESGQVKASYHCIYASIRRV